MELYTSYYIGTTDGAWFYNENKWLSNEPSPLRIFPTEKGANQAINRIKKIFRQTLEIYHSDPHNFLKSWSDRQRDHRLAMCHAGLHLEVLTLTINTEEIQA